MRIEVFSPVRKSYLDRARTRRQLDEALVVHDRGRREGGLVDQRGDADVDIALVRAADAVEVRGRKPEVGNRRGVVGIGGRADRAGRQRAADGVGAVAGGLDVDDPEARGQLVAEVHAQRLQPVGEGRIEELVRIAAGAEAQIVDDVVAVALGALLGEERHHLVVAGMRLDAVEPEVRNDVGKRLGNGRHGGERDTCRHQPARPAPDE